MTPSIANPMFSESAEFYDLIYSRLKDYRTEAHQVAELLRGIRPLCHTILDVACGTGEHARLLAAHHGFEVDGLDLNPGMLRIARAKHPGGRFYEADMVEFDLGRRYDAVLCLFSSIGYVRTPGRLRRALKRFREHVAEGGAVLVEPWFTPEVFQAGHTSTESVETGGRRIVRTSHTEVRGRVCRLRFDYEIQDPTGARRLSEVHELGLFTVDEMLRSFAAADLLAEYDAPGLSGRGLYLAKPATRPARAADPASARGRDSSREA